MLAVIGERNLNIVGQTQPVGHTICNPWYKFSHKVLDVILALLLWLSQKRGIFIYNYRNASL